MRATSRHSQHGKVGRLDLKSLNCVPTTQASSFQAVCFQKRGEWSMATNPPKGDGHRIGAVRERSQVYNPTIDRYVKRDTNTGRFMDVKSDGTPFKGVRKEK